MPLEDNIKFIAKDYFYAIVQHKKDINFKEYYIIIGRILNLLEKANIVKNLSEKAEAAFTLITQFNKGIGNSLPDDYIKKAVRVIINDRTLEPNMETFEIDDLFELLHEYNMRERQKWVDEHPDSDYIFP